MERPIEDPKPRLTKVTVPADRRRTTEWFADGELHLLREKRPNVMIIGPTRVTDSAINLLVAGEQERVWFWTPAQPIRMSERTIVVIRDVGILAPHVQAAWMDVLDQPRACPLQVITTNTFAVFPLVQRGLFLEGLYYRLNCVLVNLRRGAMTS